MKRRKTMQPVAKLKFIGRIRPWVRERRALSTSRANDRTPFAYSRKSTIACEREKKLRFGQIVRIDQRDYVGPTWISRGESKGRNEVDGRR